METWAPGPACVQGQDSLPSGHSQARWEPQYLEARAAPAWTPALGGVIECDIEQATEHRPAKLQVLGVILFPTLKVHNSSTQLSFCNTVENTESQSMKIRSKRNGSQDKHDMVTWPGFL